MQRQDPLPSATSSSSSLFQPTPLTTTNPLLHFPEQEQQQLKCPRCDSTNTKFCYYNNYNLAQPRHFCKSCRRYWTKGGALRNIPVGGGTRKPPKRASSSSTSSSSKPKRPSPVPGSNPDRTQIAPAPGQEEPEAIAGASSSFIGHGHSLGPYSTRIYGFPAAQEEQKILDIPGTGGFGSLLPTSGQFMSLLEGTGGPPSSVGEGMSLGGLTVTDNVTSSGHGSGYEPVVGNVVQGSAEEGSENYLGMPGGWPDLAIYTPGSSFHHSIP